jgi:hypothetical protein
MQSCIMFAACAAVGAMPSQQNDVLHRRAHQESEPYVLERFRKEVTHEGDSASAEAHRQWPPALVMLHRRAKDEQVGEQGRRQQRPMKALTSDEPEPSACEDPSENTQARGTQCTFEHGEDDRPEL